MKITPIYKHDIISLPAEAVSEKLSTATVDELRVLIAVMHDRDSTIDELAAKLDITKNAANRALKTWVECGAITIDASSTEPAANDNAAEKAPSRPANASADAESTEKKSKLTPDAKNAASPSGQARYVPQSTVLPHYTGDEIASIGERTEGFNDLTQACQQVLGKIFSRAETSIIIGLIDHLSLPNDYILLLCSHAANMGKPSVRYVEKCAIELFDRGVMTYADLEVELNSIEQRASLEGYIRDLFGIGKRAFTKKEKDFIAAWVDKYKFSREMIRAAYEATVNRINDPTLNYANAILENWYAAGYTTVEQVEAAEEERSKTKAVPSGTSFSTDSFFETALKRSYGDNGNK